MLSESSARYTSGATGYKINVTTGNLKIEVKTGKHSRKVLKNKATNEKRP